MENETLKILWDFEKQKYHLIPTRRPDLGKVKNKKKKKKRKEKEPPKSGLCGTHGPLSKIRRKPKVRQLLRPCKRTEKAVKYKSDVDTN